MAESNDTRKTIQNALRIVRRHWRLFALGWAVFAFGVLVISHHLPREYTGKAIFVVRPDVAVTESDTDAPREQIRVSMRNDLMGYEAVHHAVKILGLDRGLPHGPDGSLTPEGRMKEQQLVYELMDRLEFRWEVTSPVEDRVQLSFTHYDPALAQNMPNTLVELYIRQTVSRIENELRKSQAKLAEQVRVRREKLEGIRERRVQFERQHRQELPANASSLQRRYFGLSESIQRTRASIKIEADRKASIEAMLQGDPNLATTQPSQTVYGPNPAYARLEEQLREAREQRTRMIRIAKLKEAHPRVREMDIHIEMLREKLEATPEETVVRRVYGGDRDALLVERATSLSRLEEYERTLRQDQAELQRLEGILARSAPVEQEYLRLTKEEEEAYKDYATWNNRLESVEEALELEVAKQRLLISTVQAAQEQYIPSDPSLSMIMMAAFVGGAAFGGGLVFLRNWLDRTFTTSDDLAKALSVPVLGVIGHISTQRDRIRRKLKSWVVTPLVGVVLVVAIGAAAVSAYMSLRQPKDVYEEFKADPAGYLLDRLQGEQGNQMTQGR
jgi:uncharacterized protein involved in exopolysaccharide biosynthesis